MSDVTDRDLSSLRYDLERSIDDLRRELRERLNDAENEIRGLRLRIIDLENAQD